MNNDEIKKRITAVLSNIDMMSKNGALSLNGVSAIQTMAGCIAVLGEVVSCLEEDKAQ